jgi:hypothetical protein
VLSKHYTSSTKRDNESQERYQMRSNGQRDRLLLRGGGGILNLSKCPSIYYAVTASAASSGSSPVDKSKSNFSHSELFEIVSLLSPRTAALVNLFSEASTRYFCAAS